MKEKKFRVWHPDDREMIYFPALAVMRDIDTGSRDLMLGVAEHLHGYEGIHYFLVEGGAVLMQFIGLLDKSGKEIYEGDVVIADWHWTEPHEISYPEDFYDLCEFSIEDCLTVLGNIYENPQLKTT